MPKIKATDNTTGRVYEIEWTLPRDPTDDEIQAEINKQMPATDAMARATRGTPILGDVTEAVAEARRGGYGALPIVGGLVGSLAGKRTLPGVALAAAGGAVGEGARQMLEGEPLSWSGIGQQAAIQGGGELLGRGVMGVARRGGRKLYDANLKASKSLKAEYPTSAQDLLDRGVPIGARGQRKQDAAVQSAGAQLERTVGRVDRQGVQIPGGDAVKGLNEYRAMLDKMEKAGRDVTAERAALAERERALQQRTWTFREANEAKQGAQTLADKAFRAEEAGSKIAPVNQEIEKGVSRGIRESMVRRSPEFASDASTYRTRLGGQEMLDAAVERERNNGMIGPRDFISLGAAGGGAAAGLLSVPGAVATAALLRALQTPWAGSRMAIGINRTLGGKLPKSLSWAEPAFNTANAVRAALLARLGLSNDDKSPER